MPYVTNIHLTCKEFLLRATLSATKNLAVLFHAVFQPHTRRKTQRNRCKRRKMKLFSASRALAHTSSLTPPASQPPQPMPTSLRVLAETSSGLSTTTPAGKRASSKTQGDNDVLSPPSFFVASDAVDLSIRVGVAEAA